jgi:hypothetical protein
VPGRTLADPKSTDEADPFRQIVPKGSTLPRLGKVNGRIVAAG